MFVSLADKNVAEYYRVGLGYEPNREIIALLLEELSKKVYAEKLSAVTSMGHLYITTALRWDDNTKNDSVFISHFEDAGKNLIVVSYHSNGRRIGNASRRCSLEEAIDYIDLYVMKLLLVKYGKL